VVAEEIHLRLRAYQKIENGETKLDIERLQQLATVFNVGLLD
jgi:transcriptional regulator with XRE-family HTH domain